MRYFLGLITKSRRTPTSLTRHQGASTEVERYAAWFDGKNFTSDWVSRKLPSWQDALADFQLSTSSARVLEIGTYEGRSAVAFLEMLPGSHVVAVDFFPSNEVEARFDRNLEAYGTRCEKIKGRAISVMDQLSADGRRFDVIYLDGGKMRDDTFAQSALAWPMLNVGGVLIWDDLRWKLDKPGRERPAQAIDLFSSVFAPCLEVLHRGQQLIVRKLGEWPGTP